MRKRNDPDDHQTTHYAAMGMAALIPGMQYMLEQMQRTLDELRAGLVQVQHGEARSPLPPAKGKGYGWADMTAEERSAEMKRRQAKARKSRAGRSAAVTRWARMSKTERANWRAKMAAGRRKAQTKRRAAERAAERELARAKRRVNGVLAATMETRNHEHEAVA